MKILLTFQAPVQYQSKTNQLNTLNLNTHETKEGCAKGVTEKSQNPSHEPGWMWKMKLFHWITDVLFFPSKSPQTLVSRAAVFSAEFWWIYVWMRERQDWIVFHLQENIYDLY